MEAVRPQTPKPLAAAGVRGEHQQGRFASNTTTPHVKLNASRSCFIVLTKPGFIAGVITESVLN